MGQKNSKEVKIGHAHGLIKDSEAVLPLGGREGRRREGMREGAFLCSEVTTPNNHRDTHSTYPAFL